MRILSIVLISLSLFSFSACDKQEKKDAKVNTEVLNEEQTKELQRKWAESEKNTVELVPFAPLTEEQKKELEELDKRSGANK